MMAERSEKIMGLSFPGHATERAAYLEAVSSYKRLHKAAAMTHELALDRDIYSESKASKLALEPSAIPITS